VAASRKDIAGKIWDAHEPISAARRPNTLAGPLALAPDTPAILDALYPDQDQEYLDALALEKALDQNLHPAPRQ
jgi:hypothetical protein